MQAGGAAGAEPAAPVMSATTRKPSSATWVSAALRRPCLEPRPIPRDVERQMSGRGFGQPEEALLRKRRWAAPDVERDALIGGRSERISLSMTQPAPCRLSCFHRGMLQCYLPGARPSQRLPLPQFHRFHSRLRSSGARRWIAPPPVSPPFRVGRTDRESLRRRQRGLSHVQLRLRGKTEGKRDAWASLL